MDKHLTYYLQLTKATLTGGFFTSKGFYSVGVVLV